MDLIQEHRELSPQQPEETTAMSDLPFVSVIMPVRNEAEYIENSLSSVLRQNYPHHLLEVWVADGASTDGTAEIVERLASKPDIAVRVVQNPKQIAPSGLNVAISRSRGEIIVRVDGHCEIEPSYITECVKYLADGRADGVGGPIETIGEGNVAQAIAQAMSSRFGVGGSAFRTVKDREMYTDSVAFPAYTREIIERAGLYNEELVRNQDDEYNYRIRKLGGRILLSPSIRSRYFSRSTFQSLWRQYFQYGYWKVRVLQLHPAQMSLRQFVPFGFVATLAILSLLSVFSVAALWLLSAVTVIYVLASVLAAYATVRGRIKILPHVALSYMILHLSYGLGSMVGLVAFGKYWFRRPRQPFRAKQQNQRVSADTQT